MTDTTIIDQPNKFLINCLMFEFDLIKLGRTRIKTAIKNNSKSIFPLSIASKVVGQNIINGIKIKSYLLFFRIKNKKNIKSIINNIGNWL